jgi:hypothetical protein
VTAGTIAVSPQTMCTGGSATFTVTGATGAGLVYSWSYGASQRAQTLTPSVTLNNLIDAGGWSATVSNASNCSATTAPTQLSFYSPTISQQPADYVFTSASGNRANFSTAVTGSYGYYYDWYFQIGADGAATPCTDSGAYFPDAASHLPTLTVSVPIPASPVYIWCEINDGCSNYVETRHASFTIQM